jgi:4'-phosphopantetheinyl transferase
MLELAASDFLSQPLPPQLGEQEIHLWFFPHSPAASNVAESGTLHLLLAAYMDCAATDVRIERDEHGKPRVSGTPPRSKPLQFNLSHSGGALLVGISRQQALGVDLEHRHRARPALKLARRYFDPVEADALAALPEISQQSAFLQLWSGKEAVLKAHGQGIGFGLARVVFELDGAGQLQRLARLDGELAADWRVMRLRPAEGFSGALAWRGAECRVRACVASR